MTQQLMKKASFLPAKTKPVENIQFPSNSLISQEIKDIIKAWRNDHKISELTKTDQGKIYAGETLKTIINRTIFESGMKVENPELVIISVIDDIFLDFQVLTIDEIRIAFRLGVRGRLGEFMGMNVRTFYRWLNEYSEGIKREAVGVYLLLPKPEDKPKGISYEQRLNYHNNWLNSIYSDFDSFDIEKELSPTQTGYYFTQDYGNVVYELFRELELMEFTITEVKICIKKATGIEKNKRRAGKAMSEIEQIEFRKFIQKLIENKDQDTRALLRSATKKELLNKFLFKIKISGISLKELVENAKEKKQWKLKI
jgi:hypothetical protein